jgi:hypothetical protein
MQQKEAPRNVTEITKKGISFRPLHYFLGIVDFRSYLIQLTILIMQIFTTLGIQADFTYRPVKDLIMLQLLYCL